MPEFTRVKLTESGHEVSVPTAIADLGEGLTVLDKPAVDNQGLPLEPKFKTTVTAAAKKKTQSGGESADTQEGS